MRYARRLFDSVSSLLTGPVADFVADTCVFRTPYSSVLGPEWSSIGDTYDGARAVSGRTPSIASAPAPVDTPDGAVDGTGDGADDSMA
ncbi:hypothetical protein QIS74_01867 [Colletotrichum tabaci]|uniref:Uncharacterized protein n=1 Tax=Colletotrichum tabaci TaxID=1209068 RepID=A0AAV9TSP5_9PEZI